MRKTIIQRLQNLGFSVTSGHTSEKGGFIVRTIGRAQCESCQEKNLYSLYEVVKHEMCARSRVDDSVIMEWMDERIHALGAFCNTCGAFSQSGELKASSLFGRRLTGVNNVTEIIFAMETVSGELKTLSKEQLEQDVQRLDVRREAVMRELKKRKGYRD